jgi:hypothetical protein
MARVRGMAFLGIARYLKHHHGDDVLARIVADAPPVTRNTFARKIDGLSLQPYEAWIGLLRSADRLLGSGDLELCKTIGDLSARYDLDTIFKGYKLRPSAETMIRACTPIWSMYNDDAGAMEALDTRPERTVLCITGFPEMDPAHCKLMEGWMIAAMDVVGARVLPGARETECAAQGGRFHEFSCRWEPKTSTPPPGG